VDQEHRYNSDKAQTHTWLYSIAINVVKKDFLDKKKMPLTSIDKRYDDSNTCMEDFLPYQDDKREHELYNENMEKARIIKNAIYNMPPKHEKYKKVLILREIDNLAYDEISEYLGINLSTIKSQIKKGRELIAAKVSTKINYITKHGLDVI